MSDRMHLGRYIDATDPQGAAIAQPMRVKTKANSDGVIHVTVARARGTAVSKMPAIVKYARPRVIDPALWTPRLLDHQIHQTARHDD